MALAKEVTDFTVRIPNELATVLRTYASTTDQSVNEVFKLAVRDYVMSRGRPDIIKSAFDRVLAEHELAFEKLKDL